MVRARVVVSTALKSAALKVSANLTTQLIARWRAGHSLPLDRQRVLEFALFGLLSASFGCFWHEGLESHFPTRRGGLVAARHGIIAADDSAAEKKKDGVASAPSPTPGEGAGTSWRNVLLKVLLDQTVGLLITSSLFLVVTNIAHVAEIAELPGVVNQRVWHIIFAGWAVWPLVALANFLWVPVESRVVLAACVGFGWSIFLSVISMKRPS